MNDLLKKKADYWNTHLKMCMNKYGLKQQPFIIALNKEYGTHFGQKDISRWLNVGTMQKNGEVGFPKYDTMAIISDFFHVDIGYLTGETDAETFSLKKMSSFTGLSCEAIKAIQNITSPTSHFHFGYDSEILRKILSAFLQSDSFVGLIDAMHSLNDCELSVEQLKEKLSATFDEATIQRAFTAITGTDDYEHDTTLPPLPENVIAAYKMIKDIQDKEYGLSYSQKIARFELNEAFILLINELFGNDDKPIIYK